MLLQTGLFTVRSTQGERSNTWRGSKSPLPEVLPLRLRLRFRPLLAHTRHTPLLPLVVVVLPGGGRHPAPPPSLTHSLTISPSHRLLLWTYYKRRKTREMSHRLKSGTEMMRTTQCHLSKIQSADGWVMRTTSHHFPLSQCCQLMADFFWPVLAEKFGRWGKN